MCFPFPYCRWLTLADIRLSFEKAADLQRTGAFIGINNQREVIRAFLYAIPLFITLTDLR